MNGGDLERFQHKTAIQTGHENIPHVEYELLQSSVTAEAQSTNPSS